MRSRKDVLRTRVKGPIAIEFSEESLSAHAGLEFFGRFLRAEGWLDRIREIFSDRRFDSDYGSFRMTLVVIGLLLLGGERLAHLEQLRLDPVFHRFALLLRLPSERTFSRWLKDISEGYRDRLRVLLRDLVARSPSPDHDRCGWNGDPHGRSGRWRRSWVPSSPSEGSIVLPADGAVGTDRPNPGCAEPIRPSA